MQHTNKNPTAGRPTFSASEYPNSGLGYDSSGNPVLINGNSVVATFASYGIVPGLSGSKGMYVATLAVTGGSGSTGVFASMANPFGIAVIVTRLLVVIATQSAGASTLDIGIAVDASTSNDGLIDGRSAAATGTADNLVAADAGTNGKTFQAWGTTQFLNVKEASGDVNGLAATVYAICMAS